MNFKRIIQVEVTSACQAGCVFCPRTLLKTQWISKNLGWEDFANVLPAVKKGTLVHLQGWGEPLLHPRLWDMAAAVRQRNGKVSLTTNATLMDDAASREITHLGLEFVAISLADADSAVHDSLRSGTVLDSICGNIRYLTGLKDRPRVHIAMQMMKPNLERLPEIVELAARLGADRIIASNLDCIAVQEVDMLRAFGERPDALSEEIVEAATRRGRELKIEVEIYPLHTQSEVAVCRADPLHTAVVTVMGEVAPCVYLALPLKGDIQRIFRGKMEIAPRFVYGRLTEGFDHVMGGETARSFISSFSRRSRAAMLRTAHNLALLAMPRVRSSQGEFLEPASQLTSPASHWALPPAPRQCLYCYKLYGI